MRRTIVIGLGNPLLSDDGVGIKVAQEVQKALKHPVTPAIKVMEAGAGGLRLMEMMVDYDRAILIDAITDWPGGKPGQIHRLTLDDLRQISPAQHTASAHDVNLPTALAAGRPLDLKLPEEIVIFAIGAVNVSEFGEEPTPEILSAVPGAVEAVLQVIYSDSA